MLEPDSVFAAIRRPRILVWFVLFLRKYYCFLDLERFGYFDAMGSVGAGFIAMPANEINGAELWTFDLETSPPPYNATCNRIYDFLYLGGHLAAENVEWLKQMRVTCVINVRKVSVKNKASDIEYMDITVDDDEYEPIHWYFDDTIEKIEVSD